MTPCWASGYSLYLEIITTIEFNIYSKKIVNFDQTTTKDKTISEDSHEIQLTTDPFITKTRGIFVILHLLLIYMFNPKIIFILRHREYAERRFCKLLELSVRILTPPISLISFKINRGSLSLAVAI